MSVVKPFYSESAQKCTKVLSRMKKKKREKKQPLS